MARQQTAAAATSTTPTQFPNNGALIQTEGGPVCQIVLQQVCPLPNSAANNLYGPGFQSLVDIVTADQFNSLPQGPTFDDNACLVSNGTKTGLYSWGQFYWVLNETVYAAYNFTGGTVYTLPAAVFNEMPQGLIIAE